MTWNLSVKTDSIYRRSEHLQNERLDAPAFGPYISPEGLEYIDEAMDNEREEIEKHPCDDHC